jgi:glutathione S-transferase
MRYLGRKFLVGDTFSNADLTFASLAAPIVFPPELTLYNVEKPPAFEELVAHYRSTPAGQFALRLFAEHRTKPE